MNKHITELYLKVYNSSLDLYHTNCRFMTRYLCCFSRLSDFKPEIIYQIHLLLKYNLIYTYRSFFTVSSILFLCTLFKLFYCYLLCYFLGQIELKNTENEKCCQKCLRALPCRSKIFHFHQKPKGPARQKSVF